MKLKDVIETLGADGTIRLAEDVAKEQGVNWDEGACFVFSAVANDIGRTPGNIGGKNDCERAVIEKIIGSRLTHLAQADLRKITYAHRLGMSAENILGLILEEFLAVGLREYGWHCAWGETVKSVDFVHEDGRLLQIKNRSNSENSSSSSVRDGTEIEKWYRIKADRIEYMWIKLNELCGTPHLSETLFVAFVKETIRSNPDCLAVEQDNPWQ